MMRRLNHPWSRASKLRLHGCLHLLTTAFLVVGLSGDHATHAQAPTGSNKLDIVIKGGRIVDGTGAPWYVADIGIDDGKIVHVGRVEQAAETVIDASGLVVAPGFVDMMGQTATPLMENPKSALNLLTQGITTINAGEGVSAAPLSDEAAKRAGWATMGEYFSLLESQGLPINVVQTIGLTQVREIVIGDQDRRPSPEELERMKAMVREAMEAGAIGVSTALIYPPAIYAPAKEIADLATVAGQYGGRYYTHMRNEGDQLLEAIEEALQIGRDASTPVHIFHLKTAGQQNWGKMPLAIANIREARSLGQQVTADIYPYINNGLGIEALIHPRHFAKGYAALKARLDEPELRAEIRKEIESTDGWENWYRHAGKDWSRIVVGRTNDREYAKHPGLSVAELAKTFEQDPWETFFRLVKSGAFVLPQTMSEANKILAMRQEFVSFCTDVGPASGELFAAHPRAYGSFPRLFSRYVRDLGMISLERAVAQASAAAANNVMAYDRGRIAVGMAADVIAFNELQFIDRADFVKPDALSEGMRYVIVNGQLVFKDGQITDALPGVVLRGPGFDPSKANHQVSSGQRDDRFAEFDRLMHEFLKTHRVPGASIAVAENGKVTFAKGYGYSDVATREPVTPASRFRVASISKPITAVAILRLVDDGKLKLDDKVFEVLDFESDILAAGEKFEKRLREITIAQLLEHRGGWDRDKSFDAMFRSVEFATKLGVAPPADQATVIRAMLTQSLDFEPGDRYAYSNFGYCLLGRVIEKLSGKPYEEYVQSVVLAPLGITTMSLGKTRLEGRAKNEVRYYHASTGASVFKEDLGERLANPYGAWNLEAMDSHGGWIATASDLAKFALAFDDRDECRLLNRETVERMFARPEGLAGHGDDGSPKDVYYSLGWQNRVVGEQAEGRQKVNSWHTGSLPGTSAIMIRRHDGVRMVALLNTRDSPKSSKLSADLDQLLHRGVDASRLP